MKTLLPLFILLVAWLQFLSKASGIDKGYAEVKGGKLYYEVTGRGPAVILIHAHSVDSRMWESQFSELEKTFRVVRYDLRGYGRSSLPEEGVEFSHVEDLLQLMQHLKIGRANLVGLSLGSWVALDFLATHSEKVASIAVASGGLHDPENWQTETLAQRRERLEKNHAEKLKSIELVKLEGLAEYKRKWVELLLGWCGPERDNIRPALTSMVGDWSGWQPLHLEPGEGTSTFADSNKTTTTTEVLSSRKSDTPILILIGDKDAEGSQQASKYLAKILPAAQVIILKNVGHFSAMESPQAFNSAIFNFFNKTSPSPQTE